MDESAHLIDKNSSSHTEDAKPPLLEEEGVGSRSSSSVGLTGVGSEAQAEYLKVIKANGVRPNKHINNLLYHQNMASGLVVLQLSHAYLGEKGTACFAQVLGLFASLQALGLGSNGIENAGAKAVCAGVCQRSTWLAGMVDPLAVLDLSGNTGITRIGGQEVLNMVGKCKSLCRVNVKETRVTEYFSSRIERHCRTHFDALVSNPEEQVRLEDLERQLEEATATRSLLLATAGSNEPSLSPSELGLGRVISPSDQVDGRTSIPAQSRASFSLPGHPNYGGRKESSPSSHHYNDPHEGSQGSNPQDTGGGHSAYPGTMSQSGVAISELVLMSGSSMGSPMPHHTGSPLHRHATAGGGSAATSIPLGQPPRAPSQARSTSSSVIPPQTPIMAPTPSSLSGRQTSTSNRPESRFTIGVAAPYDEAWEVDSEGGDLPARPDAPRPVTREAVLHSSTPHFDKVEGAEGSVGEYSINHMPERSRTIYGYRTPTPFGFHAASDSCPDSLVEAVFKMVEEYEPKDIELPTKLLFPGKLDYAPAVHAPDVFLYPSRPTVKLPPITMESILQQMEGGDDPMDSVTSPTNSTRLPPVRRDSSSTPSGGASSATPTGAATDGGRTSVASVNSTSAEARSSGMYWNFFETAHSSSNNVAGTGTNRRSSEVGGSPTAGGGQQPEENEAQDDDELPEQVGTFEKTFVEPSLTTVSDVLVRSSTKFATCKHKEDAREGEDEAEAVARRRIANPQEVTSLSDLLVNPHWDLSHPTGRSQIQDYCASNGLDVKRVSAERVQPTAMTRRDFILRQVIKHSKTESLTAGCLNELGTHLATASYDMTCKVWSVNSGKKLLELTGHTEYVSDCCWNAPACDKIITVSYDYTARIWNAMTGEQLKLLRGHNAEIVALVCSDDGQLLATGGVDDICVIWKIESGEQLHVCNGHEAEVVALHFNPAATVLASGSMDETIRLWSTTDGSCIRTLAGHQGEICTVKFNCHGNILVSASVDETCRLWDVATGNCKSLRGHSRSVSDCCFSPDGWLCASASEDGTGRIWDVISGGCLGMLVGHDSTSNLCRITFDKTGQQLITGATDRTAMIWDVANSTCRQVLRGHKGIVIVQYNAASDQVMTMSKDNVCKVWKLEPPADTLLHNTALAIVQHPTLFNEIITSGGAPQEVRSLLERLHKKMIASRQVADPARQVTASPTTTDMGSTMNNSSSIDTAANTPLPGAGGSNSLNTTHNGEAHLVDGWGPSNYSVPNSPSFIMYPNLGAGSSNPNTPHRPHPNADDDDETPAPVAHDSYQYMSPDEAVAHQDDSLMPSPVEGTGEEDGEEEEEEEEDYAIVSTVL